MSSDPNPTWNEFAVTVGQRLLAARKEKGISQEKLARIANIATFTYQKLEKGIARPGAPLNPRLTTLIALCKALDLRVEDLLAGPWPDEIPSVERAS
ncbi:XRE family transcriptional regulator [Aeromicrobium phragmitis]|uniref:XRE family transcriptional regulator n=1 Tax=Aeromicrobium phragmitis TaxID=2478914 RepID=A0A3L8PIZ7_9ACTN|nr:helix-turn-helix transcriptional regulator [Aeromicrobium phragmitis]RLV54528.1 XRE family transcriptional regulator [Aeromicrobium phragmitis]